MLHRRGIAVLISGVLVGAQIGIAAIDLPETGAEEFAEPEYVEPAPSQAEAPPQDELADQGATIGLTEESGYVLPSVPGKVVLAPRNDVFPRSCDELEMLPALAAYLDRKAATTILTGAPPPVFPQSTDDLPMLPAMVAYFDRLEATRLAGNDQSTTGSDVSWFSATKDFVKGLFSKPDTSSQEKPDNVGMAGNGSSWDSDN